MSLQTQTMPIISLQNQKTLLPYDTTMKKWRVQQDRVLTGLLCHKPE